jgi:heterodisulfide reductase subunit C/nitrate reductase gamma subunit
LKLSEKLKGDKQNMVKQIIFAFTLLTTLGVFTFTTIRIIRYFSFTRTALPIGNWFKRFGIMMRIAFGQTKIFRRPVTGFFHALVFWGFCVILLGSVEMMIDGLSGSEKALKFSGIVYQAITASGDIFALLVTISIIIFLVRRLFLHIKRFEGIEMKTISHIDANFALILILLLMLSLLGMNMAYVEGKILINAPLAGIYPVSNCLSGLLSGFRINSITIIYEFCWWAHILLIFLFANLLPYSKHFHVFMSVPNVFLSRLDPLGKLTNMDNITREVRMILDPGAAGTGVPAEMPPERFGVRDAEDVSWKNYLDSLACTECGRCTSVCPANITGKRLSPRKIMMDLRARMKEKGPLMIRNGKGFTDNKSLIRDYISEEELWACTTCNACAMECPININHPCLIVDMRRYLVMEEASAPGALKSMFNFIENNGAPWQFSAEDRLLWANDLEIKINQGSGL